MINSYTNTNQAVATNSPLLFNVNSVKTGCTVTHSEGTASFSLNKPGFYYVSFSGVGFSTGATGGTVIVQLQNKGVNVPGALASADSTTPEDIEDLSFSTIIQVKPSCCAVDNTATLTLVNTGISTTYSNANLVITKLC